MLEVDKAGPKVRCICGASRQKPRSRGAGVRERVMGGVRESPGTSNGIKLALASGCVGSPLVWGIIQTLVNAIKAFQ